MNTSSIQPQDVDFVFFGTPEFSVTVLDILKTHGLIPRLIITTPDKPQGRKLVLTPPPTKLWAQTHDIPCVQPARLTRHAFTNSLETHTPHIQLSLCIVVAYGLLIPDSIISIPTHGILNLHPSLLPRLRGASPIESAILSESETGVSIMLLDTLMDHGPIIAQKKVQMTTWPPYKYELEHALADVGGTLLAETVVPWVTGSHAAREQDHAHATYCEKIEKKDMEIHLHDDPYSIVRAVRAFAGSHGPYAYFFDTTHSGERIRVKITQAEIRNNTLHITHVIPEGKNQMTLTEYLTNIARKPALL